MIWNQPDGAGQEVGEGIGVAVLVREGVNEGVYVGSPGGCVRMMIWVGRLVEVAVGEIACAIVVCVSEFEIHKLPKIMMSEIKAAPNPVMISRREFIS
jgi:hypothetical protein